MWKPAVVAAVPALLVGIGIGASGSADGTSSARVEPSPVVTVVYEPTPVPTVVPTVVYEPTPVPTVVYEPTPVPTIIYTTAPQAPGGQQGGGAAPAAEPAPAPDRQPAGGSYSSCREARAAGAAPLYSGQPGYSRSLDRDGDGVACE